MTGLRFWFRVTLRRLDLAAEIYHLREPQKIPLVMSTDETRRLLAVASSLKARVLLSLGYGCGLRAGEVVRLKVKHICSPCRPAQKNPRRPKWQSRNPACCRDHVRAAGAACSSSRPSCAAASRSTAPQRLQLGSTPRDPDTIAQQTKPGSLLALALRRN